MARGARTTACQAAEVIAVSTRLSNAKRTCGGLVDFASKTHSQPMVMRDNRSGAISANVELAHLKRKIRCGASFLVQGASPAKNSALTSAGAELRLFLGVEDLAVYVLRRVRAQVMMGGAMSAYWFMYDAAALPSLGAKPRTLP
jgi:hypothetical protein